MSTVEPLDFSLAGVIDAKPADIVSYLQDSAQLPDLAGIGVVLTGIGEEAAPQPALPQPSRTNLTAIWTSIVVAAGALQFTAWKAYHLACCRTGPNPGQRLRAGAAGAWRHGVRLGLHCSFSSAGLTALLFAAGLMDLRAMAAVTAAITVERLAPAGERIARATGAAVAAAGVCVTLWAV